MHRSTHRRAETGDVPVAAFADAIARLPTDVHRSALVYLAGARDTARAGWHSAWERRGDSVALALSIATETDGAGACARVEALTEAVVEADRASVALAVAATLGFEAAGRAAARLVWRREAFEPSAMMVFLPGVPAPHPRELADAIASLRTRAALGAGDALLYALRSTALDAMLPDGAPRAPAFTDEWLSEQPPWISLSTGDLSRVAARRVARRCATQANDPAERAALLDRCGVPPVARDESAMARVEADRAYRDHVQAQRWRAAADDAGHRAALATDASLAATWGVLQLAHLLRAGERGALLSHAAQIVLARSAEDAALAPVARFAAEIAVSSLATHGLIHEAAELAAECLPGAAESLALAVAHAASGAAAVDHAVVTAIIDDPDLAALLPLALRHAAQPVLAVTSLRAVADSTTDTDHSRRLREYAVFVELFRLGRPSAALTHARALFDAPNPSLPALWAMWFAAWETNRLADLVPMLRRRAFAAPQPLRDHLHAALADAAIFGGGTNAEAEMARIQDPSWQASIRARVAQPERHRAISGAFASVSEVAEDADARDVIDVVDEGREHLLHGRWSDAAASFLAGAESAERAADRGRLMLLASRAAGLSADAGVSEALLLRALREAPEVTATWDAIDAQVHASGDSMLLVAACDEHGPPQGAAATAHVHALLREHHVGDGDAIVILACAVADGLNDGADGSRFSADIDALAVVVSIPHFARALAALLAARASDLRDADRHVACRALLDRAIASLGASSAGAVADAARELADEPSAALLFERATTALGAVPPLVAAATELAQRGNAGAASAMGWAAERIGDRTAARRWAADAIAANPRHASARVLSAQLHEHERRWDEAVGDLEVAARNTSDALERAALYRRLGELCEGPLAHPQAALENFLVAFVCDSDDPATLAALDRTYRALDRVRDLVGTYEVAIAQARANPSARLNVTDASLTKARLEVEGLGDRARAAKTLRALVQWSPTDAHAVDLFVQVAAGHLDDAEIRATVATHLNAIDVQTREQRSETLAAWC